MSLNCLVSASPPAAPKRKDVFKILEKMLAQLFVGFYLFMLVPNGIIFVYG